MLKHGKYKYINKSWQGGKILLEVKETPKAFKLKLIESTVRYDAPQIDDMFRCKNDVTIRKDGSNHAVDIGGDDWFCLYPYRCGAVYLFEHIQEENK